MRQRAALAACLILILSSCNMPAETVTPTVSPTATDTPVSFTSTPRPTRTPNAPMALVNGDRPVNCRYGPGMVYDIINVIEAGQSTEIVGRDASDSWWYVKDPGNPDGFCWVAMDTVETNGDTESIPMISAPPAAVAKIVVRVEPQRITVACDMFPQVFVFYADITVDGPTIVTWRWEINTGDVSPEKTMIFETAGTQTESEFYRVYGPNDYWVKARALTPNEMVAQIHFFAFCPP